MLLIWRVKITRKPLWPQFWVQWSKRYCLKCSLWIRSGPCMPAPFSWDAPSEASQPPGKQSGCSEVTMQQGSPNQPCGQSTRRSPETLWIDRDARPASRCSRTCHSNPSHQLTAAPWEGPSQNCTAKPFLNSQLRETVSDNKTIVVVLSLQVMQQ